LSKGKKFHHTLSSNGTYVGVRSESKISHPTLDLLFNMMKGRGWEIQTDQGTLERYPSIAKDFFEGKKGDLLFKSHRYPVGFEIEFYQEINTKNPSGGRYDFDKLKRMPYLIRCRFLVELNHIKQLLIGEGYKDDSEPVYKYAADRVEHLIKSCWHYEEGKADKQPSYNATDKDGNRLRDGQLKHFRDRKGRLQKGIIYHNINNMWWVILNKFEYTNIASFYFFDLNTEENRKRKLVKPSGMHNPKARRVPDAEQIEDWRKLAKKSNRQERIEKANKILSYLYSINWTSRKFQFYLKDSGRAGLQELESKAWGMHKVFDNPVELSLYSRHLPMSSTESSWIKGLRDYVVHGKAAVTPWFCTDRNGEGSSAYKWPEVREKLWKIGALAG
jgi:hypothetical protein